MATVELVIPFAGDYPESETQPVAHGHFAANSFVTADLRPTLAAALAAHTSAAGTTWTADQTGFDDELDAADPIFRGTAANQAFVLATPSSAPVIDDPAAEFGVSVDLLADIATTRSGPVTVSIEWHIGGAISTRFYSNPVEVIGDGVTRRFELPNVVISGWLAPEYLNPVFASGDMYMTPLLVGGETEYDPNVPGDQQNIKWIGQATDTVSYLAVRLSWEGPDVGRMPPLRQVQRGDGLGSSVPRAIQNNSRQASLRASRAFI